MKEYAPGHFLALVRRYNWPPNYSPSQIKHNPSAVMAELARQARDSGKGFGANGGTIQGLAKK